MHKNNSRIVRVSMLLLVVATISFAQAPPFVSTNPSQILTAFQAARGNWVANIAGYANKLFGALAVIEFAWSAAVMVLEKADLQSFTAALIRKIMWIGGFYMLLINGPVWIPFIIDSFTLIGQNSSGVAAISPSDVFAQGLAVAGALSNGFRYPISTRSLKRRQDLARVCRNKRRCLGEAERGEDEEQHRHPNDSGVVLVHFVLPPRAITVSAIPAGKSGRHH